MGEGPVKIKIDPPDISQWQRLSRGALSPAEFNRALARATNDALNAARTESLRRITTKYTIKRKDLAGYMRMRKATGQNPAAEITFAGPPIPLTNFKVRPGAVQSQNKTPVSRRKKLMVEILKGHGFTVEGSFLAQMQSGHLGVFRRAGEKRLPIKEAVGPSVAHMVGSDDIIPRVQERAYQVLDQRIAHHIDRALGVK
jgi:hypothetical protein